MNRTKYEYIGNLSQLFHVENYRMEGGKKDGVRVTNVQNETGLNFTVAADRCMDITHLSFKGVNISYINPSGIVAPEYYDRTGLNWLKSFTAGFVTTCGLDNVGNPCEDGEELGLHGRIGNTPADEYNVSIIREEEDNKVEITGIMGESFIFGAKLRLKRKITSFQEKNRLILEDEIVNEGFTEQEYMQLYHCNIGYPFLSPDCEIIIPSDEVKGGNPYSQENIEKWNMVEEPSHVGEMCLLHQLRKSGDECRVGMFNNKEKIGFTLSFDGKELERFLQWRYLNKGEYVVGLEPATNYAGGKKNERETDRILKLNPGETKHHRLQFDFYDSREAFDEAMKAFGCL